MKQKNLNVALAALKCMIRVDCFLKNHPLARLLAQGVLQVVIKVIFLLLK